MAYSSSIEWTDATWNPITGCSKISDGCKHCYAERLSKRLKAMGSQKYINGFEVTTHKEVLSEPLMWKKPRNVFVNSMSDTFHENISDEYILEMFKVMNNAAHHKFQVLTKRSSRLLDLNKRINWTNNIWLGVTVEDSNSLFRIKDLKKTGAIVKFISFEPLLDNLKKLNLDGIHWVIVGGESGAGARIMEKEWVDTIFHEAREKKIPFFFKQWGGVNKKKKGRLYNGQEYSEYPIF
ncbi:phage Gp37/Gp68 family protein [Brucepastera parasyntrophica]|uniref:DUF5131 family protein n=1 Tax=Brucepastera parasyntrophica TaxID=2880008 RepID=UPI00210E824F|nr:phage Gp37/Gp68 family protein [Brucepastera parasyntrophica]ULQ61054.1 phage Gp37/Gp68 family protein [Brucepastera parasyntrophica]